MFTALLFLGRTTSEYVFNLSNEDSEMLFAVNLDDFQNEVFLRGVTLVNKESKQNITPFHYCHFGLKK